MKASLILTTARYGGFDVLAHSMWAQTMDRAEFEIVVIDELFDQRRLALNLHGLNVIHAAPDVWSEVYDNGAGFNAGLRRASGELIVFAVDNMWIPADYLQSHWDFYKAHPGWSMTGYIDRYEFPPLIADEFLELQGQWSIFEDIFDERFADKWFSTHAPVYRERKGGAGILRDDGLIEMPGDKVYLIPDSIPLAVLKELGGIDERYDGGYGSNDIDLAVRANMIGWHFGLNPSCIVQKLGTPELSAKIPGIKKPKVRTPSDNFEMFQRRMQAIRDGREPAKVPSEFGAWG